MVELVASRSLGTEQSCAPATPAESERSRRRREVRAHLQRLGHTIASWAKAEGHAPKTVYKVLSGEVKGLYGEAHDIAVKLGIKDGVVGGNHA